jgi:alpha-ketoglutarate-dependent taurine dioxygenase
MLYSPQNPGLGSDHSEFLFISHISVWQTLNKELRYLFAILVANINSSVHYS